jgi:DNA-binding NarL/FixJ family response regulator
LDSEALAPSILCLSLVAAEFNDSDTGQVTALSARYRIAIWRHGGIAPKQILIADDSAALRRMVRCCVEQKTDWKVCGEAENGEVAVRMVNELQPDLVLLDLAMPIMNGLEAARQIASASPPPVMLMYTMQCSGQLLKEAEAVGIKEVLSKTDAGIRRLLASMTALPDESPVDAD